jgi:hypothetical protein
MGVAFGTGAVRVRSSPREPALRKARVCYDHLAGELGVLVYESLARRGAFTLDADGVALTPGWAHRFQAQLGIDAAAVPPARRVCAAPAWTGASAAITWPARSGRAARALPATGLGAPRAGLARAGFYAEGEAALRAWLADLLASRQRLSRKGLEPRIRARAGA